MKEKNICPGFKGWQEGYSAFTYHFKDKDRLIEYVKKQETHHKKVNFKEELISLFSEHGIKFDEKYLF